MAIKPPWYRRFFGGSQRAMAAGERPRSMGLRGQPRPSRLKRIVLIGLVVLVAAPVIGYFTVPAVRDRIDGLLNSGSVAFKLQQNPPANAIDKNVATVWFADRKQGVPTVTVNFTETTNLAGMIFQIGATPGKEYASHARPKTVELVFPGEARPVTMELADDPGPQEKCLNQNRQVRTFDVRILDEYPPGPGGQDLVGLRDIEFISESC